jgi:hypothetical protein
VRHAPILTSDVVDGEIEFPLYTAFELQAALLPPDRTGPIGVAVTEGQIVTRRLSDPHCAKSGGSLAHQLWSPSRNKGADI